MSTPIQMHIFLLENNQYYFKVRKIFFRETFQKIYFCICITT